MKFRKYFQSWSQRVSLRRFSIQRKLPLLICILLLGIMIPFALVSYFGIRNASLRTGEDRLKTLTDHFNNILSVSAQSYVTDGRNAASQDVIKNFLKAHPDGDTSGIVQSLSKISQDSATVLIQLLDVYRRPVFAIGKNRIDHRYNFDSLLTYSLSIDTLNIGKIMQAGDSIFYPVMVALIDNDRVEGYVVRWRLMRNSPVAIEQLSQLIGTNAKIYIGNINQSLWTDMLGPVTCPIPADLNARHDIYEYNKKGESVLAAQKTINSTPWQIVIEFSRSKVLEPANRFLKWVIFIGTIMILVGIVIAWTMSRNITRPLNKLTAASAAIASGNQTTPIEVERKDELGKLARSFNAMSEQVTKAKTALEQKIWESERMNEQLRELSAHLQNIREEERIHIAREMHDELGQFLTGLKMDIAWLNKKLPKNEGNGAYHEKIKEMAQLVDEAVIFVRKLAAELRPSILDNLGLIPALEWHSQEFARRFNIEVEFIPPDKNFQTSELIATGLFRMYQESLTNVARHSKATKVIAQLNLKNENIILSVSDNGIGFNPAGERKTLGLLGMRERALMMGGELAIDSEPGKGTTILIKVPAGSNVRRDPALL